MSNQLKTPLGKFYERQSERAEAEKSKGTLKGENERVDVKQLSREQERMLSGTFIDFDNFQIDYEKTFGKLVFLGFNSYRNYAPNHELAGEKRDYRYQIVDEVTGVDFIVNVPIEYQPNILELSIGQEIELVAPKLEPFAVLDSGTNRVNTGFSVTVNAINVVGTSAQKGVKQERSQTSDQVKQETK